MSSDDARKYEVFLKGENPPDARTKVKNFVTRTSGTQEDAENHADLFDQWRKALVDGEVGILLTRRRISGAVVATAFRAASTSAKFSGNNLNSPTEVVIRPVVTRELINPLRP